jgi:hypothetical protein
VQTRYWASVTSVNAPNQGMSAASRS